MLEIHTRHANSVTILDLVGTLDHSGTQTLKDRIQEERKKGSMKILLNFSKVSAVMSTHLQNLMTPFRALTMIKGIVAFCCLPPSIHKVIEKAMFYQIIKVYDKEEDALEELKLIERNI